MPFASSVQYVLTTDHPLASMPWEAARDATYAAARDGLDADLAWVTRERLDDGASLTEAITAAQCDYIRRQGTGEPFAAWLN